MSSELQLTKSTSIVEKATPIFLSLTIEFIYRIGNNLHWKKILISVLNAYAKLNLIVDTYHRYNITFCIFH